MSSFIKQTTFLILISASFLAGCKKNSSSSPSPATNASSILMTGSWRVSYYHESGNDHTSNFSGYTFTFNSNGIMTSSNLSGTTNGTWSSDDSHNEFHMSIGNSSPLSDISNGWLIISATSTEIDMKDDNSSHNEEFHFTKI